MEALSDALDAVEATRKTLEVYTDEATVAAELSDQFATRNVDVARHALPPRDDSGFIVIRDAGGEFRGAVGIDQFRALLDPEIQPPWADDDMEYGELFDFLDNTIFSSYDRRQMLAAAREFEERAWRADAGTLHVGFQNPEAFLMQMPVYDRFARERDLEIRIYVAAEWDGYVHEAITIVTDEAGEIGHFWFVLFDGGTDPQHACGVLAEERTPGRYYGFWTYDPARTTEIITYLEGTYGKA